MTAITPAATIASTKSTASSEPVNPEGKLEQDDFLKLMVAQLQDQNPLQPEGNSNEYLSELSTFTEVEQITSLAGTSEISGAVQLIGHEVTYTNAEGELRQGNVESVQTTTKGATLTVDGVSGIDELSVSEVH